MAIGIYISVPFCRSKCSFCNFASGVFSPEKLSAYVAQLRREIERAEVLAGSLGAAFDRSVDSIYLGGGTPSTLPPDQLRHIFDSVLNVFEVQPGAEVTVECAPGTLGSEILDAIVACGVNRVSLGTQSLVDEEIRSVGRLHTAEQTLADVARLREAGIDNINLDLIAGLPHQTRESWSQSLKELAESGVPHASVYLLEVDEDSRLGRELIAGGSRYHAHHVPDSDLAADLYLEAIEFLGSAGLSQYEISNFARTGRESLHNLKYWTRRPYFGFGLDAHSMLPAGDASGKIQSLRFGNSDDLGTYISELPGPSVTCVGQHQAAEETMFLGLRLNCGIDVSRIAPEILDRFGRDVAELLDMELLERYGNSLRLTSKGRLLSNEVFQRFVTAGELV